jgi:4-carboxymuconolactone decarboxylase
VHARGGPVIEVGPGDTIETPPGEWHWHGATPDHFMTHLALSLDLADGQPGPVTDWGDHLTGDEYPGNNPPTAQPQTLNGMHMTDEEKLTTAQRAIGDFAPKLVELTDDVLFGDVWERAELSKRDRSLVTVAALVAGGNTEQLRNHLLRAKANGLTETELKEAIIHLAFYAGWPRAMSAIQVAKAAFAD